MNKKERRNRRKRKQKEKRKRFETEKKKGKRNMKSWSFLTIALALAERARFEYLAKSDFSDIAAVTARIANGIATGDAELAIATGRLRTVVQRTCSYEATTREVLADFVGSTSR
jgi:hypothetical protein